MSMDVSFYPLPLSRGEEEDFIVSTGRLESLQPFKVERIIDQPHRRTRRSKDSSDCRCGCRRLMSQADAPQQFSKQSHNCGDADYDDCGVEGMMAVRC
jgi:hypothetical protein